MTLEQKVSTICADSFHTVSLYQSAKGRPCARISDSSGVEGATFEQALDAALVVYLATLKAKQALAAEDNERLGRSIKRLEAIA
jgi:hypothetical protein